MEALEPTTVVTSAPGRDNLATASTPSPLASNPMLVTLAVDTTRFWLT